MQAQPRIGDKAIGLTGILLVLAAITVAWAISRFWIYPVLGIPTYAPLILRPIFGFLTAWWLLAQSGRTWSEFGLARPRSLPSAALVAVVLFAAVWGTLNYVAPAVARAVGAQSSPSFLAYIRGNFVAFAGWIAIAWIVGALIEELLFRGFLLNAVARAVGHGGVGLGAGVVSQAVLFGLLHLYQGSFGFIMACLFALLYGVAYLVTGRNLWPLVLVHGTWNTVGIVNVYLTPAA
jgi:membrane protease YdiL (CAAX protease family)